MRRNRGTDRRTDEEKKQRHDMTKFESRFFIFCEQIRKEKLRLPLLLSQPQPDDDDKK
jgi:hypothetical protein